MSQKNRYINSLAFQMMLTSALCRFFVKKSFAARVKNKISIEEYAILEIIICYPHLSPKAITENLFLDEAQVKKSISQLCKKNFIKEEKENSSKIRLQYYKLTNEGEKYYNEVNTNNDDLLKLLSKFISEKELIIFFKTLVKIRNILVSLENSTP